MLSAVEGDKVLLSCDVDSDPHYTLTYHWYHNSSEIHAVTDNGSLVLQSVSKADSGFYTCFVDSDGGQDNSTGYLHIIGTSERHVLVDSVIPMIYSVHCVLEFTFF